MVNLFISTFEGNIMHRLSDLCWAYKLKKSNKTNVLTMIKNIKNNNTNYIYKKKKLF